MVLKQLYDNLKSLSEQKKNGYKVGKLRYKGEGWYKTDKKLWQREHSCPSCGYTTDRDYNEAQNILGTGRAEVTPADTGTAADHKDQNEEFCDVSASCVIETGNPFHLEA